MTGKTVSIVGAGPAGLTSACQPALEGLDGATFEAWLSNCRTTVLQHLLQSYEYQELGRISATGLSGR